MLKGKGHASDRLIDNGRLGSAVATETPLDHGTIFARRNLSNASVKERTEFW